MTNRHFSKKYRLCKKNEFMLVLQKGKRLNQPHLTACVLVNNLGYQRLAISIGRKFGQAHDRNRFKRLVRESFRQSSWRDKVAVDIAIMPNNANPTLKWDVICQEIESIMQRMATFPNFRQGGSQ